MLHSCPRPTAQWHTSPWYHAASTDSCETEFCLCWFNKPSSNEMDQLFLNFPKLSKSSSVRVPVLLTSVEKILLCIRICMLSYRLGAHNLLLCVVACCNSVFHSSQLCSTLFTNVQVCPLYRAKRNVRKRQRNDNVMHTRADM